MDRFIGIILVVPGPGFNYTSFMWIWALVGAVVSMGFWWTVAVWPMKHLKGKIRDARDRHDVASSDAERLIAAQLHDNWVLELQAAEQQWWRRPVVTILGKSSVRTLVVHQWR